MTPYEATVAEKEAKRIMQFLAKREGLCSLFSFLWEQRELELTAEPIARKLFTTIGAKDSDEVRRAVDKVYQDARRLSVFLKAYDKRRSSDEDYFFKISRAPGKYKLKVIQRKPLPPPIETAPAAALHEILASVQQHERLIQRLFLPHQDAADQIMRIGLTEWTGSEAEFEKIIYDSEVWLKMLPDDVFVRAAFLWCVLTRGTLKQMIEVIKNTVAWVGPDSLFATPSTFVPDATHLQEIVCQRSPGHGTLQPLLGRHIEDTLVRAAFLRWLKGRGKSSELGCQLPAIQRYLRPSTIGPILKPFKRVTSAAATMVPGKWLVLAINIARKLKTNSNNALLHICWLWLIARDRPRDPLTSVVQETFDWVKIREKDTLVRTALVWLVASRDHDEQIQPLVDEIRPWLIKPKNIDDSLVWVSFLWLIGRKGTGAHVTDSIDDTIRWLNAHPDDNFVRIALLLFVVRSRCTPDQRTAVIVHTRRWLKNPANDQLTDCAIQLTEFGD